MGKIDYIRLYKTKRWRTSRALFLKNNPQCVFCGQKANVVDHIDRHQGNLDLFWNPINWQPLCKLCHDNVKRRIEYRGYDHGCSDSGDPIDPNHPWNNEF